MKRESYLGEPTGLGPYGTRNYDPDPDERGQLYFAEGGQKVWNEFFDPNAQWVERLQYNIQFTPFSLGYPWIFISLSINFVLWLAWLLTDILVKSPIWVSVGFSFAHCADCIAIVIIFAVSVMGVQSHVRTAHILQYIICVTLTISQYASVYSSMSRLTNGEYLNLGVPDNDTFARLVRAYSTSTGGLGTINASNNRTNNEFTMIVFMMNTMQLFLLTSVVFFKAVSGSQRYEERALKKARLATSVSSSRPFIRQ